MQTYGRKSIAVCGLVTAASVWVFTATQNTVPKYDAGGGLIDSTIVDVSGRVGIGTANPQRKLDIVIGAGEYGGVGITGENFSAADPATRLRIQDSSGGVSWFLSANNDGKFAVHQGGVGDRLVFDNATGNVGIGTTSPRAKLEVVIGAAEYGGVGITGENFSAADPATRFRIQDSTGGVA